MSSETRNVTETELAILSAVWDHGPITVREIVESVYGRHTNTLHATVKSLLERLADKEYVRQERRGFAHVFAATLDREAFVGRQLQKIADSHFDGSFAPMLLSLLEKAPLTAKDRQAIRKIVEKIE